MTQPCFQWHLGHQKLFFKLLLFPLRTGRASLTEGPFHVTAPGRGCHGNGSWGCSGADGCVSTRVVLHCLLPDMRPSCSWGALGSCPHLEGAQLSDPRSANSSDRPSPWSPERQACPLIPHLHVRTQPLGTKGHRPPLRGCRIRVQGAFIRVQGAFLP